MDQKKTNSSYLAIRIWPYHRIHDQKNYQHSKIYFDSHVVSQKKKKKPDKSWNDILTRHCCPWPLALICLIFIKSKNCCFKQQKHYFWVFATQHLNVWMVEIWKRRHKREGKKRWKNGAMEEHEGENDKKRNKEEETKKTRKRGWTVSCFVLRHIDPFWIDTT